MRGNFLLVLVACLGLISPSAFAVLVDKIAAVVNSEVILQSDLDRFERTIGLRKELDPLFGFSDALEGGKTGRAVVLDFLIQERLITQTFKVPDSDVDQEIQTIQRNNNLDHDQLVEFLKTKGFDYEEYRELMRVGLAKRNLLDREIRNRVNVSDDDVHNYCLNKLQKNTSTSLEYSLQMITINFRSYKTPKAALEVAEAGLRAIKEGESFTEVAKRVSDDPSASSGGELGYLPREHIAPLLQEVASKLKIGEVSSLVKNSNGYAIVKLLDARSLESSQCATQKEQIREILAKEEYKKQLFIWAERARNNAYVRINN